MNLTRGLLPTLVIIIFLGMGCSHHSITSPGFPALKAPASIHAENHMLTGLYTFICDPAMETIDFIPLRNSGLHLNALKFLEPPANVFLSMESPPQFSGNILDIDIGLRNPYLGQAQYTGFDVCGIVFTHGLTSGFNDPDIVMASAGDTRLLNADGYTRWWNPSEFPHGSTIFNYIDGLLGTPAQDADFNCTINGYKFFADHLDKNSPLTDLEISGRGLFSAGKKNVRHYTIDMSGGLIFNYAVDACWKKPQGGPPWDVPEDFPPAANRPEAYNITVTELENSLFYSHEDATAGGRMKLLIDVWDHFNAGLNRVYGESPAGLPFTAAPEPAAGGEGYSTYELDFTGEHLTANGTCELLITVQSEASGYGGILPDKPVCAYFMHSFQIREPLGWARTWGSDFFAPDGSYPDYMTRVDEIGCDITIDHSGNIFVVGNFGETVDFDPGPGEDFHTSNGCFDAYLTKFNPDGQFQWAHTWGGPYYDRCRGVALDDYGNIYVVGDFIGTVDFDPTPGISVFYSHSISYCDAYMSKFSADGQYLWTRAWGGTNATVPYKITIDNFNNAYIVGEYLGTVDFDPGPDDDIHTGTDNWFDAFFSKFDLDGNYQWGLSWGGYGRQAATRAACDSSGDIYITGNFTHTCDFDPGDGVEQYTAAGEADAYISKFDANGDFLWTRNWGGPLGYDHATGLTISSSNGIYVSGRFVGTVDFDPGPGVDEHSTGGANANVFLSKFDPSGNWQWTRTWGGQGNSVGYGATADSSDCIYVTGFFTQSADFDPGPDIVEYTSNGGNDAFVSKFNADGDFLWALAWGGVSGAANGDRGLGVITDQDDNAYITGMFETICDFQPGPGEDNHTSNGGTDCFLVKFSPEGIW